MSERIGVMLLVIASLLASGAQVAQSDLDGEQFRSEEWRVRLTAPRGWQLSEQTSYPSILLRMVRRKPSATMLVAAERLAPNTDALKYALSVAKKLESLGYEVRAPQLHAATGAYLIDFADEGRYLRQALLVANGIGYSLTLSASDLRTRGQLLRPFDYTLRSIRPARERPQDSSSTDQDEASDEDDTKTDASSN